MAGERTGPCGNRENGRKEIEVDGNNNEEKMDRRMKGYNDEENKIEEKGSKDGNITEEKGNDKLKRITE